MTENTIVDARGLSCPQPVMLTHQAIQKMGKGTVEVLVDSDTARENVSRIAQNSGWKVDVEKKPEGEYQILITK
jgi:tRNA 2-thiouridine synthesizing protein A